MHGNVGVVALFVMAVAIVGLFSFLSVASWATARQREREAFYRYELARKLAEIPANSAESSLEFIRQQERRQDRQRRDRLRLSGLLTIACGLGLFVFLLKMDRQEPAYFLALIPLLVGIVLLGYSSFTPSQTS